MLEEFRTPQNLDMQGSASSRLIAPPDRCGVLQPVSAPDWTAEADRGRDCSSLRCPHAGGTSVAGGLYNSTSSVAPCQCDISNLGLMLGYQRGTSHPAFPALPLWADA